MNYHKIGEFLSLYDEKCGNPNLSANDVSGINRDKEFFEPSRQVGKDTSGYNVVPPGYFACNLMHVGRDRVLPISLNQTNKNKIVSSAYTIFRIENENVLLKEYFLIYLKCKEKDRYFWFCSDSSTREGLDYKAFCNIDIAVPNIKIQLKYINLYKSISYNQYCYEKNIQDLKISYEGLMNEIRKQYKTESIIKFLQEKKVTNSNGEFEFMRGVGLKGFIEPNQKRSKESMRKCKIVNYGDFVYPPSSFKNGVIVYNDKYENCLCSEEYIVFNVKDEKKLLSKYLLCWLQRSELGRYVDFMTIDSVRNRFYFEDMKIIEIPVPPLELQTKVAKLYEAYCLRYEINEKLKKQVSDMCPILIRGSLEEKE